MRIQVQSLASLSGLRIQHCCELWCRSHTQLGSGIVMLWCRPAATTLIQPLAWEPPDAASAALKSKKKKKENKKRKEMLRYGLSKAGTKGLWGGTEGAVSRQGRLPGAHPQPPNKTTCKPVPNLNSGSNQPPKPKYISQLRLNNSPSSPIPMTSLHV